jgi:4-amino-4-deoxy-L-arabinose transferase-like glycosyltransferase
MAAAVPLGDRAAFLLVPLFGALLVILTWRAGLLLGDSLAGAIAALLLSFSPTFLLQLIQPMSDVPAAACWAGAVLAAVGKRRRSALAAGVLTGMAVLIRPNLAPLALIVLVLISITREARAQRMVAFLAPAVIAAGLLMMIQAVRYGSPLGSGYGDPGQLFALANIPVNLRLYARWITFSLTPVVWLWIAAPVVLRRARTSHLFRALAALVAGTWCAYLPYVSFRPDEWFYTRFLLPAIPFMLLFASMVILAGIRRAPAASRAVIVSLFVLTMGLVLARTSRPVLRITTAQEQRYRAAGTFVRDSLPADAIVFAVQHSGSVRYYSSRTTIRWDIAAPAELDAIVDAVRRGGFSPYVVVDASELSAFRGHFPGQRTVDRLRPLAEFGMARVYSVE